MSAQQDAECRVYYCVVCGPCMKLIGENADIIVHQNIPHPEDVPLYSDYEDVKQ